MQVSEIASRQLGSRLRQNPLAGHAKRFASGAYFWWVRNDKYPINQRFLNQLLLFQFDVGQIGLV